MIAYKAFLLYEVTRRHDGGWHFPISILDQIALKECKPLMESEAHVDLYLILNDGYSLA